MKRVLNLLASSFGLVLFFVAPLLAQGAKSDSAYRNFAALVRASKPVPSAARLLTQVDGAVPSAQLNALADSMVALVLSPSSSNISARTKLGLLMELMHAAAPANGVPFEGAPLALFRAGQSDNAGVRAGAMSALGGAANKGEALKLLVRAAESKSASSVFAVHTLIEGAINKFGGQEALHRLWDGPAVTDPTACEELAYVAKVNNWKPTSLTSCR